MIKIVVDSNIVFSAILNTNSRIAQILLTSNNVFKFFAPKYLRDEILEHQEKIMRIAKLNGIQFLEVYELILKNITLINHSIVKNLYYKKAYNLCESIDIDDTPFIALSLFLESKIWTGDKKLIKGLGEKGFNEILTTDEMFLELINNSNK